MRRRTLLTTALLLLLAVGAHGHPPYGIACDGEGNVLFLDWPVKRVIRLTADGKSSVLADLSKRSPESHPHALAVGPDGALYVAETYGAKMWRIGADGGVERHRPAKEEKPLPPGDWLNLAFGPDGNLFLVLAREVRVEGTRGEEYRIVKVGKDGAWSELYRRRPGQEGYLRLYYSCAAVGKGGKLYLTHGERLLTLSDEGKPETVAGEGLGEPWGVVAHPEGGVLLLDQGGGRLLRVTAKGEVSVLAKGLFRPYALTWDGKGGVLVGEETLGRKHRIRRIGPEGKIETVATVDAG